MSHSSGYDYALQRRLQRERELAALRRQWNELARLVQASAAVVADSGLGISVSDLMREAGFDRGRLENPSDSDLDGIASFAEAWRTVSGDVAKAQSAKHAAASAAFVASLRSALGSEEAFTATGFTAAPDELAATGNTAGNQHSEQLIALLAELTDEETRAALTSRVMSLVDTGRPVTLADSAWRELTEEATAAVRRQREAIAMVPVADDLRALLARIDGPERANLTARIAAAASVDELERLRPAFMMAVKESERRAEREFVLRSAIEVWRELGYSPTADFSDAILAGGTALLSRPEWSDHAVQVRMNDDGQLATNVVAFGDSTELRDDEVAKRHCSDDKAFADGVAAHGIDLDMVRRLEPGRLPLQRIKVRGGQARANGQEREAHQ